MPFWDRFILALSFGLAPHLPVGRDAALRILDRAIQNGRLSLSTLTDTSLLLLLALLPESSNHRPVVAVLVAARRLTQQPAVVTDLLQAAVPGRLNELIEIGRPPGPHLRHLVLSALYQPGYRGILDDLSLYLGRLHLLDPAGRPLRNLAGGLIAEATRWYYQIPIGTVDYLGQMYRLVRLRTQPPGQPLRSVFPPGVRPAWFLGLAPEEQRFLDTCTTNLSEPAVDLLYLHFYARLSVEQISRALRLRRPKGAMGTIVRRLEESWNVVL